MTANTPDERPWSRLDLPTGECLPLERRCPECIGQSPSFVCGFCDGKARVPTQAGRSILDLVQHHAATEA